MTTMRAMTFSEPGGPEVLTLSEVERPMRLNAEVLVRVVAAGVNPIDAKTRAGRGVFAGLRSFPVVLGGDISGVVVEAPYEAHPLQPGTAVFGMGMVPRLSGGYAEYVSLPQSSLVPKPEGLDYLEAAAVPLAALTAWGMVVDTADVQAGQRVLIHAGAGGVGHFAVQFAALAGAEVITTASPRNAEWLGELGAGQVIDYTTTRFEDVLSDVDVVIDLLGDVADDSGSRSLKVMRPGGLLVNAPTGSWPTMAADAAAAGMRATGYRVSPDGRTLAEIARLIDAGQVRVHVDQVFDLEDVDAAHRAIESGHTRGKIVLRVSEA